jgi:hypothetical protein
MPGNKHQIIVSSILTGAFFVLSQAGFSQSDTVSVQESYISSNDTTIIIKHVVHKKSPRVATIASAIVPGLGQAYNGKYWKIPIIYGGGAAIYYFYDQNNSLYKRFKTSINQYYKKVPITDPELKLIDIQSLEANRDQFRRWRDYNIMIFGLLYAANIVDAMVDSYMVQYDISRDLTLHIDPTFLPSDPYSYTPTCGLKLSIRF